MDKVVSNATKSAITISVVEGAASFGLGKLWKLKALPRGLNNITKVAASAATEGIEETLGEVAADVVIGEKVSLREMVDNLILGATLGGGAAIGGIPIGSLSRAIMNSRRKKKAAKAKAEAKAEPKAETKTGPETETKTEPSPAPTPAPEGVEGEPTSVVTEPIEGTEEPQTLTEPEALPIGEEPVETTPDPLPEPETETEVKTCLLYTSDAADE